MILKISIIPEEELRNLVFYETVALDFVLLLLTQAILAIYISLLTLHSDCAILLYAKKLEKIHMDFEIREKFALFNIDLWNKNI